MVKFYEELPDSERVIKDKEEVKQFTYAVRFADKQPGIVDISAPQFQFRLGNKQYYLWVSEQFGQGTLMKLSDTGTVYWIVHTFSNNFFKGLVTILNRG